MSYEVQYEKGPLKSVTIADTDGDKLNIEPSFDGEHLVVELRADPDYALMYLNKDDARALAQALLDWAND